MGSVMSQEYRNTHQDAMFHLIGLLIVYVAAVSACFMCLPRPINAS